MQRQSTDTAADSPASSSATGNAFSLSQCTTSSMPSSPFTDGAGQRQPSDSLSQLQTDDRQPPRRASGLQLRPSGLNRTSGGSLGGRQSLGGPSASFAESFTSWDSFRAPEEQQFALAASMHEEQQEPFQSSNSLTEGLGRGGFAHSAEHAEAFIEGVPGLSTERSGGDLIDTAAEPDRTHEDSSAGEDPFRERRIERSPTADSVSAQPKHAKHEHHPKRPSLSQWELQQLSGFAVSQDGKSPAEAMRSKPISGKRK